MSLEVRGQSLWSVSGQRSKFINSPFDDDYDDQHQHDTDNCSYHHSYHDTWNHDNCIMRSFTFRLEIMNMTCYRHIKVTTVLNEGCVKVMKSRSWEVVSRSHAEQLHKVFCDVHMTLSLEFYEEYMTILTLTLFTFLSSQFHMSCCLDVIFAPPWLLTYWERALIPVCNMVVMVTTVDVAILGIATCGVIC